MPSLLLLQFVHLFFSGVFSLSEGERGETNGPCNNNSRSERRKGEEIQDDISPSSPRSRDPPPLESLNLLLGMGFMSGAVKKSVPSLFSLMVQWNLNQLSLVTTTYVDTLLLYMALATRAPFYVCTMQCLCNPPSLTRLPFFIVPRNTGNNNIQPAARARESHGWRGNSLSLFSQVLFPLLPSSQPHRFTSLSRAIYPMGRGKSRKLSTWH